MRFKVLYRYSILGYVSTIWIHLVLDWEDFTFWSDSNSHFLSCTSPPMISRAIEVWFTLIFFFCFLASLFRLVSKTDTTWEVAAWRFNSPVEFVEVEGKAV